MSHSTVQYWDRRLDALDWKTATEQSSRASWSKTCRSFYAPAAAEALDQLGNLQDQTVLELGSGHGQGAVHLAARGAHVVALDISSRRCAEGERQMAGAPVAESIRFCAARAERLPFADASFDAIFARDVLMYADPVAIAVECRRVVRPGGKVVFVESLAGPWFLRLFRWVTSPRSYLAFTRHLRFKELQRAGSSMTLTYARPYYLFSLAAFIFLLWMKLPRLHEFLLKRLYSVDRAILDGVLFLSRWAWRGTVTFVRPD